MQIFVTALSILVILALVAVIAMVFWWRRFQGQARQWATPFTSAIECEQRGEYGAALDLVRQALAAAEAAGGVNGTLAARAAGPALARLLYRTGDLNEAEAISLDLLEAARSSP